MHTISQITLLVESSDPETEVALERIEDPSATNAGILCSKLYAFDTDVDDPRIVAEIIAIAEHILKCTLQDLHASCSAAFDELPRQLGGILQNVVARVDPRTVVPT